MITVLIRISLYYLIGTTFAQNTTRKPLDTVIDELSSIARLTNGIAIEAGIVAGRRRMEEVVAEFMGLRSADVIGKMKQMKVADVVRNLAELYPLVGKVAKLKVKTRDLQKIFETLEEMKKNADVLEKTVHNPSGDIENRMKSALSYDKFLSTFYKVPDLLLIIENLQKIRTQQFDDVVDSLSKVLRPLFDSVANIIEQFAILENFETESRLTSFLELQKTSTILSEVSKIAMLSEQFTTNFPTFLSMATILRNLKKGILNLKAVAEKQKSMPNVVTSLEDMSAVAVELSNAFPSVRLTVGFAGGIGDLKLMFDDLKGEWMRNMIAGGKETTELVEKMAAVSDLHTKLEELDGTWKKFERQKYVGALKKVPNLLLDAMNRSQFVPDIDSTATSLESLQKCFTNIKMPPSRPDYHRIRYILDYGGNLSAQITATKEFLSSKITTLADTRQKLIDLNALLSFPTNVNITPIRNAWNTIKHDTETEQLMMKLQLIYDDFQNFFATCNPFVTIKTMEDSGDWTAVPPLLTSLDGSNLLSMIKCLNSVSYQAKDIDSVLDFAHSIDAMKSERKYFTETDEFLSQMSKVQQGLMQVEGARKRRRRRRDVGVKSMGTLKNAEDVSVDLSRGVQVLRQFSRILDVETSMMVAGDADDVLKKTIDAIRGSESVWNDENRESLKKMVSDVEVLNDAAATMKRDTMPRLWLVFDAARQVPRVEIDAKVFGNPIAIELSSNVDPKMKAAAKDFEVLATLDLNFAQHHLRLKAASLTLVSLRQFFDNFFATSADPNRVAGALLDQATLVEEDFSSRSIAMTIILIVIGVSLLIGVVAFIVVWRRSRGKKGVSEDSKRWFERERHWMYDRLWYPAENISPIMAATVTNKPEKVKELLEEGPLLEIYYDGYTLLQWAVKNANPEIVEMLICAGADRGKMSLERRSAKEMATRMSTDGENERRVESEQVLAVFEKYEGQTFNCRLRDFLPVERFSIKLDCGNVRTDEKVGEKGGKNDKKSVKDQFVTKHPNITTGTLSFNPTHVVVDVEREAFDLETAMSKLRKNHNDAASACFFSPQMLVKPSWLEECLKSDNLHTDYDHRVRHVMYDNNKYETVDEWKKWMNGRSIGYLQNVQLAFYPKEASNLAGELRWIAHALGGVFYDSIEALLHGSASRDTPAPFWFPKKKKLWIVYGGVKETQVDSEIELIRNASKSKKDAEMELNRIHIDDFMQQLLSLSFFAGRMPVVEKNV